MRRRRLLAALGAAAGLAGCSGLRGGTGTPDRTLTPAPVPSGTATPTPAPFEVSDLGAAAVGESTVGGRTLALSPPQYGTFGCRVAVRFVAPATTDHPARLAAVLQAQAGDQGEVAMDLPPFVPTPRLDRVRDDPTVVGNDHATESGDETGRVPTELYLAPVETSFVDGSPATELVYTGDVGVWRLAEQPDRWLPDRLDIGSRDRLRATFELVAPPDVRVPPGGRYRTPTDREAGTGLTAWETAAPGPEASSRFAGYRVGSLPDDGDTWWFHRATSETNIFLRPHAEIIEPPATVALTLVNHSLTTVETSDWTLYKSGDDAWHDLGPYLRDGAIRFMPPGGRHTWRFVTAHDGDLPSSGFEADGRFPHLGGGLYAVAGGRTGDTRLAALLRVDAPDLRVSPTDGAEATRDGSTVRVRGSHPPDEEPARLTIERLGPTGGPGTVTPTDSSAGGGSTEPGRLIPEQVMRARGLRNTLPFFASGVEAVRLETAERVVTDASRIVRQGATPEAFRFGEGVYRLTAATTKTPPDDGGTPTDSGSPTAADG